MSNHATGPRSDAGKERSSLNAMQHGLRSERPVISGEDAAEWDAFCSDIVARFAPADTYERELAERVALQLWRLRRVSRYEAQVANDEVEGTLADTAEGLSGVNPEHPLWQTLAAAQRRITEAEEEHARAMATRDAIAPLRTLPDDAAVDATLAWTLILLVGGSMDSGLPAPTTAGALRDALLAITGRPLAEALALATAEAEQIVRTEVEEVAAAKRRLRVLAQRVAREGEARGHDRRLLQAQALDRVVRYEAHVSRQLKQAQDLLRTAQAERREREELAPVPVPRSFGNSEVTPAANEVEREPAVRSVEDAPRPERMERAFVRSFPDARADEPSAEPCRCKSTGADAWQGSDAG